MDMTNKFFITKVTDKDSKVTYYQNINKTLDIALVNLASEVYRLHFTENIESLYINIDTRYFDELGNLQTRQSGNRIEYSRGVMLDSTVLTDKDFMKVAKILDRIFVDRKYNVQYNIGHAKYVLNFYNGFSEYDDGSERWGINIFSNKKKLNAEIKELESKGYKYNSAIC